MGDRPRYPTPLGAIQRLNKHASLRVSCPAFIRRNPRDPAPSICAEPASAGSDPSSWKHPAEAIDSRNSSSDTHNTQTLSGSLQEKLPISTRTKPIQLCQVNSPRLRPTFPIKTMCNGPTCCAGCCVAAGGGCAAAGPASWTCCC